MPDESERRKSNFLAEKLKRAFTAGLIFSSTFSFCCEGAASGIFTYEKIHFTQDGSPTGMPLVPNFVWNACWAALGNDDDGNIYAAISNHSTTQTETSPSSNTIRPKTK